MTVSSDDKSLDSNLTEAIYAVLNFY